ncbi:MAG: glycosyltransferase family 4 protein [Chloroflexota bacterium]|nr:glycosyltransferase family 4 protein [Chloroflexota bacterium]
MSLAAACIVEPHLQAEYANPALVLGRALHAPWNEGTRVINRNFARVASSQRSTRVLSVTDQRFRSVASRTPPEAFCVEHVFTPYGYGWRGMQMAVPHIMRRLGASDLRASGVAHLFGVPLSLAPWLRSRGIRVVVHVMAVSLRRRDRLLVRLAMDVFRPWIDAFAVSSEALVSRFVASGIPASKLLVMPHAIDMQAFLPGDGRSARQYLGVDPGESLVVYLGRLSPRRFPANMIASALSQAASQGARPIRLLALSPDRTFDGSENTAEYLLECSRVAERLLRDVAGVAVDVRLGSLAEPSKIALFRASDAVLLPFAATEAVEPPLTLIEAMACGANVVATPAANRSGLIRSGYNGFIGDTPAQFSARLADALALPRGTSRLGNNARRSVLDRHSFAAVGDATAGVWRHVEGSRTAAR